MTDQNIKQLPLRLPQEDYDALKNLSFFTGHSMNAIVVEVLHLWLETIGRDVQLDAMVARAQDRYRPLLDKLASS